MPITHDITREIEKLADDLGVDRKRSIGDVAKELNVETHIIRFWEEKFSQIKPEIGAGKRRYYYNKQLKILKRVKKFLYEDGYTISGLQKLLKKRKPDNYKEEDLNIISQASYEGSERKRLEIGDFVSSDTNAKSEVNEVNIENSDRRQIENILMRTRSNLEKLKVILYKSIL